MLTLDERAALQRVIAIVNGKGGSGKSSLACNLAGVLARSGYRTLLIDTDPQGDAGQNLGYRGSEADDNGENLLQALLFGSDLTPIPGVRERLDAIPAGRTTEMISPMIAQASQGGAPDNLRLARALAQIASDYDIVIIDCPPRDTLMQLQVLSAARWVLSPTQPEHNSITGVRHVLNLIKNCRETSNPDLAMLGQVLIPVTRAAKRVAEGARKDIEELYASVLEEEGIDYSAPTFDAFVGLTQSTAAECERSGRLAIEVSEANASRTSRSEVHSLAQDYVNITRQLLTELNAREKSQES